MKNKFNNLLDNTEIFSNLEIEETDNERWWLWLTPAVALILYILFV